MGLSRGYFTLKTAEPSDFGNRAPARRIHADAVPAAWRAVRAKEWLEVARGVAATWGILGLVLSGPDGLAWEVLRTAVGAAVAATFVLWAVLAFRGAGGARTWLGPLLRGRRA